MLPIYFLSMVHHFLKNLFSKNLVRLNSSPFNTSYLCSTNEIQDSGNNSIIKKLIKIHLLKMIIRCSAKKQ